MPRLILGAALLGLAIVLPTQLTAQPEAEKPVAGKKEEKPRRSPLPTHWGMIGVSDAQRDELHAVRDDYEPRLEALRKQLKALEDERETKMESILTPGQKLRLQELREEAKKRAAQKPAATPAAD